MALDPITAAFDLGKIAVERLWPDPIRRAAEIRKLEVLRQQGNLAELNAHVKLMLGQIQINMTEARHGSLFVAGWRPFIGWVGGFALVYQFILYPLGMWSWAIAQAKGFIPADIPPPPVLDSSVLFSLITGMLGVGVMRSYDKAKNIDTKGIA